MTWLPIATINPQYVDEDGLPYVGAVLKAYSAGTSTNINMATDNTGGTTATSMALNAKGYIEVSGTQVIPHVEESYKLTLYPTQADADSDVNAIWTIDNLTTPIDTEVVDLETTVDKAASYTAVLADKRKTINVTAAATISLGDASTMGTDYRITVKNSHTAAITVDLDTALDTLDSTAAGSVTIYPKRAATFTTTSGADGYKIQSNYSSETDEIAGHTRAGNVQLYSDDANAAQIGVETTVTEATWESFGATGSGADNIWTVMDALPSTATALIFNIQVAGSPDGVSTMSINLYGSIGSIASPTASVSRNILAGLKIDHEAASADQFRTITDVIVPIGSAQTFKLYWTDANSDDTDIDIYYRGFMTD